MIATPTKNHIGIVLGIILDKYFTNLNCLNLLYDEDFIDIPGLNETQPCIIYNTSYADLKRPFHDIGCHGMVLYTRRPKNMFNLLETIIRFTRGTKFHERRYIIMHPDGYKDDVFTSINLEFVADFVVGKNVDDSVEFWTNKFVGTRNHSEPIFVDKWLIANQSFVTGADFYRDKFHDMEGRSFRISTFDYKPYINIDTEHGIELMMAKEYIYVHNMTSFIIIEENLWGIFFEDNYTATGAKGSLLTDKADISMGSWYRLPNYTKFVDITESSVRIGVTFLVPAPKLASSWFTPLFAFSNELWDGFIVTFLILSISLILYDYTYQRYIHEKITTNLKKVIEKSFVLNFVTLFLQQSSGVFLTVIYLRGMYFNIIILGLFFAAVYSAGYSAIMTMPRYEKSIKDSLDLDKSGIKWGAIHPALLDGFRDLEKYQNVVKNIIILNNDEIRYFMHKQGFSMLVDRVPNGLVLGTRVAAVDAKYYRVLTDDLYSDHCTFLVKRSSVFIPTIRHEFLTMKEAGLLYFWEMQALFEENYAAQIVFRSKDNRAPFMNLSWAHVQGVFAALWMGLGASFLAFLWELTHRKCAKKKI